MGQLLSRYSKAHTCIRRTSTQQQYCCLRRQSLLTVLSYLQRLQHMSLLKILTLLAYRREHTGSSYSGLHFDHYIVASYCPDSSLLHTAKLLICARNGVALSHWGKGIRVLLEKIVGNVFVHELRAICLLEANFNW
jgi:hypothetical protein